MARTRRERLTALSLALLLLSLAFPGVVPPLLAAIFAAVLSTAAAHIGACLTLGALAALHYAFPTATGRARKWASRSYDATVDAIRPV